MSYLSDRYQAVRVNGSLSSLFAVLSGIVQGSHIGPLLFLIFVDSITRRFKTSLCLMFADDMKIYRAVNSVQDTIEFQTDIDALVTWCTRNRLHLNISKCKIASYHRKHHPLLVIYSIGEAELVRVTEIRELGIIFDTKLNFIRHVDFVIGKAYAMLFRSKEHLLCICEISSRVLQHSLAAVLRYSWIQN